MRQLRNSNFEIRIWQTAILVVALVLGILGAPLAADAQPAGRTVTIGYLGNSSPALESNLVEAFREGLRQLGYVEGRNLIIKFAWAEGQQERHPALARELVRLRPDVLLTAGTPATLAAKQATRPSRSSRRSLGTLWRPASWRASRSRAAT